MGSIPERIEQLRRLLNMTQKDFAEVMGITQSHYSQILKGRNRLSAEHIAKLTTDKTVNANPAWLFMGKGEPFNGVDGENEVDLMQPGDGVDRLYQYVLKKRGVELTAIQALKFKTACARCYIDNVGVQKLDDLAIAANVYLNFILRFPDIEI